MATHDVDKKLLGRLASMLEETEPALARGLFQLLGLSELLSRRLLKARKYRKARNKTSEAVNVYHHVIWMSREGLAIVERFFPIVDETEHYPIELRVFFYKLRASFYHVFVLFHNNPRVSLTAPSRSTSARGMPLSPTSGNGNGRRSTPLHKDEGQELDAARARSRTPGRMRGNLRDPVVSILSEESAVTNPWATLSPPPGLGGHRQALQPAPDPAAFLLPSANYLSMASACFSTAHSLALGLLPGSAPLRLSVCLEYCAFLWDCEHDHDGCRKLASETINYVWVAAEGMEDDAFEDAAQLVGTLGRMMRRKSQEDTPKMGAGSPDNPGVTGETIYTDENPPPPLPKDDPAPAAKGNARPTATVPTEADTSAMEAHSRPETRATTSARMSIPRRPVGTPSANKAIASPDTSPTAIIRKPVASAARRPASPSTTTSPLKKSSPGRNAARKVGEGSRASGIPRMMPGGARSPKSV